MPGRQVPKCIHTHTPSPLPPPPQCNASWVCLCAWFAQVWNRIREIYTTIYAADNIQNKCNIAASISNNTYNVPLLYRNPIMHTIIIWCAFGNGCWKNFCIQITWANSVDLDSTILLQTHSHTHSPRQRYYNLRAQYKRKQSPSVMTLRKMPKYYLKFIQFV